MIRSEHPSITVVAGGYSVRDVDLTRLPGVVIAVNDSAVHLPRYDIALSMDRLWTEHRWQFLRDKGQCAWIRRNALQNIEKEVGVLHFPWLHRFECDHAEPQFSDNPHILNGTNSGGCALNLAYAMQPKRVFLLGFDMRRGPQNESHWYPSYEWAPNGATVKGKYQNWSNEFAVIARCFSQAGIEVFNVSRRSLLSGFKIVDPKHLPDHC